MNFLQRVKIIGGIQVGTLLMGAVGLAAPTVQLPVVGMWNGVPVFGQNKTSEQEQSHATRKIRIQVGERYAGECSATFVSQTTVVTAAHCVDKNIILSRSGLAEDSEEYKKLSSSVKIVVVNGNDAVEALNWFFLEMEKDGVPQPQNDHGVVVFPANTAGQLGIKTFPKIAVSPSLSKGDAITLVGYGFAGKLNEHYIAPFYEKIKKINSEAALKNDVVLMGQSYEMNTMIAIYAKIVQVTSAMRKEGAEFYKSTSNQKYVYDLVGDLANFNKKDIDIKSGNDLNKEFNQFLEKFRSHPLYWDGKKVGYTGVYIVNDSVIYTEGGLYRNQENDGKEVVAIQGDSGGTVLDAKGELIGVISLVSENPKFHEISGSSVILDAGNILAKTSSSQASYLYLNAQDCQKISDGPCADLGLNQKALNDKVASADQDSVKELATLFHVQVEKSTKVADLSKAKAVKKVLAPVAAND